MGALIGPVHDVLVGPFEIEGENERLAHALVLELLAPRVEEPALRTRGRLVGDDIALDAAVLDRRSIIAGRPDTRGEFLAEQVVLAGKTFVGNVAVAAEFEAHGVEIIIAD